MGQARSSFASFFHVALFVAVATAGSVGNARAMRKPATRSLEPAPEAAYVVERRDPALSDAEFREVLAVVDDVNRILGPLKRPVRVPIVLKREQDRFVYSKGVLHLGWSYAKGRWRAPFERIKAAIAHEWAHAVFDENMRGLSPDWRALSDWSRGGELGPPPSCNGAPRALFLMSRPYNEFFADLMTALWADDLEAMPKALVQDDARSSRRIARDPERLRGFALSLSPIGWEPKGRFKTRIYQILSPTRSFIGRSHLAAKLGTEDKARVLSAALRATASEFAWLAGLASLKEATAETLNARLIAAFEREIAALNKSRS